MMYSISSAYNDCSAVQMDKQTHYYLRSKWEFAICCDYCSWRNIRSKFAISKAASGLQAGVAPSKPKAFEKMSLVAADSGKDCQDPPFNGPTTLQYLQLLSCWLLMLLVRHGCGSMKSFGRTMQIDLPAKTRKQSLNLTRQNNESSCIESSTCSL